MADIVKVKVQHCCIYNKNEIRSVKGKKCENPSRKYNNNKMKRKTGL